MENLCSISISDFNEKIYFLNKKTNFSYEIAIKNIRNINKKLKTSYLAEHVNKNLEIKLMDSLINSKLKIKISILGDIIVSLLYDTVVDLYFINQINQRLIEALYNLTKTKKIKIEMLLRRHFEIINLLEETLYLMDPRIRLCNKLENLSLSDIIPHSLYVQKFNKANLQSRSIAFYLSSCAFTKTRSQADLNKKLRGKEDKLSLGVSNNIIKQFKLTKMQRINQYTNNKNNLNLEFEKPDILMENISIINHTKMNSFHKNYIDVANFNSGEIINKKRMTQNINAFSGSMEFPLSHNLNPNYVENNMIKSSNDTNINLHTFSSQGAGNNSNKQTFDKLENIFVISQKNQNGFFFDQFQNQSNINENNMNLSDKRFPDKNSFNLVQNNLFDFSGQMAKPNILIEDMNFNFNKPQFFNNGNISSELQNLPISRVQENNDVNIINETVIQEGNNFFNGQNFDIQGHIQGQAQQNNLNFGNNNLNPIGVNSININSVQNQNIRKNPEETLMDQNFLDSLPAKINQSQTSGINSGENMNYNTNSNNINSTHIKNNFFNNSPMDFNFNNAHVPKAIPEFNFELATKTQPFEANFGKGSLPNDNFAGFTVNSNTNFNNGLNYNFYNLDNANASTNKLIDSNKTNFLNKDDSTKKTSGFDFNLVNLLKIDNNITPEDQFDPNNIKKQIRGAIIEKGFILNNKGNYDDIKYRGQFALELTNNFSINNKTLFWKILNNKWSDSGMFSKMIPDKNLVVEENGLNYKILCKNMKNTVRLIEYNINIKQIEAGAEFKVVGKSKDSKYKLEIICILNEKTRSNMKNALMTITIILKNNLVKLAKTTHTDYNLDDKIITLNLPNFNLQEKHTIGMMFETYEIEFVEMVKISYRYMEILPTNMNAELYYYDKNSNLNVLDVAKKCIVEIRYNL